MWILGGLVLWVVAAGAVAVLIGRSIRLADERSPGAALARELAAPGTVPARPVTAARRRRVPLPPVAIAMAAVVVVLETVGYVLRLTGARGPAAQLLSMDAAFSVPRMTVAALFAAAAAAAFAGATRIPGRRAWWLAVGGVTAAIAAVKAGGTVHVDAMRALTSAVGASGAVVLSVLLVGAVLAVLAFLSRAERRDRRRVLTWLGAYAAASVGLSALSSTVAGVAGSASRFTMAATYVEESGEALAGVAVLVAVLVGVAPRLVLPAAWAMRRAADAHTLEVAGQQPARSAADGTASS